MLRIALCDDHLTDRNTMEAYLKKYGQMHPEYEISVDIYPDAAGLFGARNAGHEFDLYLLDILLPDGNGIEIAKELRKSQVNAVIIFLTSSPDYSLEAFGVKAMQYLLKPVQPEKLYSALDDAAGLTQLVLPKMMLVSSSDGKVQIRFRNICFVECWNRILHFHMLDGSVLHTRSIRHSFDKEISPLLEDGYFLKPHQSFIINMQYISRLTVNEIYMQDGSVIPVSKKRLKEIRTKYMDFISAQNFYTVPDKD